ncbi:MAG TPA: CDP-alcohol phosphatidyltransferase family protein [Candidatus Moranbacteria bacterium]|nr:CDP-alcohol phosphatidyltransferase family protein [Candidatus Moranbacteria bacterium]
MFILQGSLRILSATAVWVCMKIWINSTLANLITLIGLFLTWKMTTLRWHETASFYTFALLVGAVLSDKLDGMAAKHFGQSTALGSALDKIRDKFLILSAFFFMYRSYETIPFLLAGFICKMMLIIGIIEVILLTVGSVVSLSGAKVRANNFGRWKMGFESSAVVCWAIMFDLKYSNIEDTSALILVAALLVISLALALASAHGQIRDNWPLIKRIANLIRFQY